jgi:hypothetical protein
MPDDLIRWVVLKEETGHLYEVVSGPLSQLQLKDIPEHERLGFMTLAVVDSEAEAWSWVETHRQRAPA